MRGRPLVIYLAGPITGKTFEGAVLWREEAAIKLRQAGFSVLSPMRGKDFILKRLAKDEVLAQTYPDAPMPTQKGIVARDRFDVARADVVLFYLLDAAQVSIGTMIEIGWCDAFRKLVVVVMEPSNIHDHAFVREIAGYVVPTLDEAIVLLTALAG